MRLDLNIDELTNLISRDFDEDTKLSFYGEKGNLYIRFTKSNETLYSGAETIAISFKNGEITKIEKGKYDGEFKSLFKK
jgi:hypothetical protein